MNFDELDDDFLNFSPIHSDNLFPASLPASPAGNSIHEQDGDGELYESSDNEDATAVQHLEDDSDDGSFGDGEQVAVASDQYSWKINHTRGDHKFKGALRCIRGHNGIG